MRVITLNDHTLQNLVLDYTLLEATRLSPSSLSTQDVAVRLVDEVGKCCDLNLSCLMPLLLLSSS